MKLSPLIQIIYPTNLYINYGAPIPILNQTILSFLIINLYILHYIFLSLTLEVICTKEKKNLDKTFYFMFSSKSFSMQT